MLHLVQIGLHAGGEGEVHNIAELVLHQARHHLPQGRGVQVFAVLHHILPIQNGGDGGGIGRGPADPLLLQRPDQGRLGIAGGRLGEVLGGFGLGAEEALPLLQIGQGGLHLRGLLILALLIDSQKARKFHLGAAGSKGIARAGDLDAHAVIDGGGHLTGQKTAPDQLIQPILLRGKILFDFLRRDVDIRGTDSLVGILRAGLGLVVPRLFGIIVHPVAAGDEASGIRHGLLGDPQGIRSHVGDEAHGALLLEIHTLIELLGNGHGASGRHIQLPGCLLLEGAGDEGRRRRPALILALDAGNGKGRIGDLCQNPFHLLLVFQFNFFVPAVKMGLKAAQIRNDPIQGHIQGPIFLGNEDANLLLPLGHQAGSHRLDTSGGEPPADFLPEQGRELVTHNPVQNAPGLLGIHQVMVDDPGRSHALLDHLPGNLIEGDPIFQIIGQPQKLLEVPGDGFALPVGVRCQIDHLTGLGRTPQLVDDLLFPLDGLIIGGKACLHIHA